MYVRLNNSIFEEAIKIKSINKSKANSLRMYLAQNIIIFILIKLAAINFNIFYN